MDWKDKIGTFKQIVVTIAEMSKKSGMDADTIIGKIGELIEAHR